jgi:hypothetical protein
VKLRELILYIAEQCEGDESFSKTKLWKILFNCDFGYYVEADSSITGSTYQKWPFGPVPAGAEEVLADLQREGRLAIAERRYFGHQQKKPVALREPSLSGFSGEEIAYVDRVIRRLWRRSANAVSEESHEFLGWQVVGMGEEIPYELALVEAGPWTEEDDQHAAELARQGRIPVPA